MSANLSTTVYAWLKELKIPVSKTYLKQQLLSHPDYPSLLSITDTLNEVGIENTAVQIEKDQLREVATPFLAHLNGNGGEFVIIRNNENPGIPDFFNRWKGVVIAAERPENLHHNLNAEWEKKDSIKTKALLFTFSILTVFILLSSAIYFDWMKASLLLIAVAGVFVSWMIVSKDLGIENKIADQVCGKEAECNTVIHAEVAKLPFGVGWSDAGIIYFSFLLMTLIISGIANLFEEVKLLLAWLATATLPVTILSLYYQWGVIKKWCRLCLFTVTLLWLQFVILVPVSGMQYKNISTATTSLLLLLLFIPAAAWFWLKPLLKENKNLEAGNFASRRFKNDPEVFKALVEKQKKLAINPDGLGIRLGNPAAENTIIKVCNPYCGPCAKAHPVIDELLAKNDNLEVQVIFTASNEEDDMKAKPVRHLMALYEKNDGQLIQQALEDWYMADKKDYNIFAGKYSLNGELEKQDEKLKAMKKWCDEIKIEFTPTFFINGYQLPKQYNIEELKYFLEK